VSTEASPLLAGVRVLELSQLIAAPLCGLQLLDLGADVVKVEPPGGEEGRRLPPFAAGGESLWFHALNRGKRGVVVERGDTMTLRRLVARADVVVENLAGAAALSYDDVAGEHPALVWCAITGRGAGRGGRAVDPSLQATMGLAALTGEPGGPPLRVPVPVIDFTTAMAATQAVLAALWRVERGGRGGLVDVALLDAAATLTGLAGVAALAGEPPTRMGSQSPLAVPSGVFATVDGHVQVVAYNERQWRAICTGLEQPGWLEDPRSADAAARLEHRTLVHERLAEVFSSAPTAHWVAAIGAAGGLAEAVRDVEEAWRDGDLRERGLLGMLDDAALGRRPLPTISLAHPRGAEPSFPAGPRLGEHTAAVLAELR
jgi:crotonobetainyl-CoA:carnitine CoA-transferase CaiB-like acyl-CoA transferase